MNKRATNQTAPPGWKNPRSGWMSFEIPGCRCLESRRVRGCKDRHTPKGEQANGNHPATSEKHRGFHSLAGAYRPRNRFTEAYRVTRKAGLGDLL